jgi:hypothetical protein
MNKLLTQREFEKADANGKWNDDYNPILSAQLIKNNRWWKRRIDEIFQIVPDCWRQSGCGEETCTCEYQKWQQLKNKLQIK